jgi:cytochrome P450
LRRLKPQVDAIVEGVMETLPADRPVDVFQELAHVVPARVVYQLLGLPRTDWEKIQHWADEANDALPKQHPEAAARMRAYLAGLIERRTAAGERSDDVIDGFLHAGDEAPATVRDDVLQHVRQLIAAGTDTSSAMITNLIYRLLEDPTRWDAVRRDRGLVRSAVEESLRLDAPIQYTLRTVKKDARLAGCPVAPRDRVVVSLQSANWDEDAWGADAGTFRLDRPGGAGHIAFGSGIHGCLGAPLARIEGESVLNALLDRFPQARLAAGYAWEPVRTAQMRRPSNLMVELDPSRVERNTR